MLGINYKALPLFLNQRPAFISRHPASEGDTGKGPATETAPSSGQVRLPVSAPGIAPHPDPMSSRTPDRTCAAVALGSLLEFSTAQAPGRQALVLSAGNPKRRGLRAGRRPPGPAPLPARGRARFSDNHRIHEPGPLRPPCRRETFPCPAATGPARCLNSPAIPLFLSLRGNPHSLQGKRRGACRKDSL